MLKILGLKPGTTLDGRIEAGRIELQPPVELALKQIKEMRGILRKETSVRWPRDIEHDPDRELK